MFNHRDSIAVRPLHEDLEELGMDAGEIVGAVQANAGMPVQVKLQEAKSQYTAKVKKAFDQLVKAMPMALQVASAHKIPWRVKQKEQFKGSKKLGAPSFWAVFEPNDVDQEVISRPSGDFLIHVSQWGPGEDEFSVRAEINFEESGGKPVFEKDMLNADQAVKALAGPVKMALVSYLKKHDFRVKESMDDDDGEELDEQMEIVKVQKLRGAQLAQARKQRRKLRAAKKAYSKKYYARNKRKIAKRRKKALAKFGKKGLERLHKQHKRVMVAGIDRLSTLREELAENIETTVPEQVATNAGWLAMLLGEVFESVGEGEAAETLFELSDNAADLSERLSAVTEESLQGRNKQELEHLVTTVANGLRIYEDIGSPSLWEAVQYEVSEAMSEKNYGPLGKKGRAAVMPFLRELGYSARDINEILDAWETGWGGIHVDAKHRDKVLDFLEKAHKKFGSK